MTRSFEQEIARIKDRLLHMASAAERSLGTAMRALVERNDALAGRVEAEDSELDALEVELDEAVTLYIARNSPVAHDLRFMLVAAKIATNLERIGDGAVSIARLARKLNLEPELNSLGPVQEMAAMAMAMQRDAMTAFVSEHADGMEDLIRRDKQVDDINRLIFQEMSDAMTREREAVPRCLHVLLVARNLERIADHAKNIAEQVIYLVRARDIRHQH